MTLKRIKCEKCGTVNHINPDKNLSVQVRCNKCKSIIRDIQKGRNPFTESIRNRRTSRSKIGHSSRNKIEPWMTDPNLSILMDTEAKNSDQVVEASP